MSRLILNLLEANCLLDKTLDSRTMETLMFCPTESNRDIEADILQGDGGATSMSEEIHEEARCWIEYSLLFIPVDDIGYRWHTNCYFVC